MIATHKRKPRLFLFSWMLLAILLPGSLARQATSPYPEPKQVRALYDRMQSDRSASQADKIKSAIDSYFRLRYESLRRMQAQDFSYLAGESSEAQAWLQKAQDKQEIELAIASAHQLAYQDYEYELDYETIQVQGTQAIVRLYESHTVIFQALAPEVSRMGRLSHTLQLQQIQSDWKILGDVYVDELAFVMTNMTKERILSRLQRQFSILRVPPRVIVSPRDERIRKNVLLPYNRQAAIGYANSWGNWETSSDQWRNPAYHDEPGYDCANYVSQAIYAGSGQVMSTPSDYEKLWYYDFFTHSGSMPWLRVSSFANFLAHNDKPGPIGAITTRLCELQPGDAVQLYGATDWFHEVIVTARLPGRSCTDPTGILINAHTTDLYHYPLAFFDFTRLRYLHIRGVRR